MQLIGIYIVLIQVAFGQSCSGNCDSTVGLGSPPCYCDDSCTSTSDCCDDYYDFCGSSGSGSGYGSACPDSDSDDCRCDWETDDDGCSYCSCQSGSCDGECDSTSAVDGCYCDSDCETHDDCCDDYFTYCESTGTCEDTCETTIGQGTPPCYCDSTCKTQDDCCSDYSFECGSGGYGSSCGSGFRGCSSVCEEERDDMDCPYCECGSGSGVLNGTCDGYCDGTGSDGCYCDTDCEAYGDCCGDYVDLCVVEPATTDFPIVIVMTAACGVALLVAIVCLVRSCKLKKKAKRNRVIMALQPNTTESDKDFESIEGEETRVPKPMSGEGEVEITPSQPLTNGGEGDMTAGREGGETAGSG